MISVEVSAIGYPVIVLIIRLDCRLFCRLFCEFVDLLVDNVIDHRVSTPWDALLVSLLIDN